MKRRFSGLGVMIIALFTLACGQEQSLEDLLRTPKGQERMLEAVGHNHEFVMKLIDRLSEQPHFVHLMTKRFGKRDVPLTHSPYAGNEGATIKSITDAELRQYRNGEGMGMAKPAELNGYPGPRHVLDASEQLQLAATTKKQIESSFDRMHENAVRLGNAIIENERKLDSLFATRSITRNQLEESVKVSSRLQGELRLTHLQAHLETEKLLSSEQVLKYNDLRGYLKEPMHTGHEHH